VSKNRILQSFVVVFLFLPIAFLGCSGGGDDAPARVSTPSIQVIPSSYNFGIVTSGNSPAPFEARIQNNGSVTLNVSSIILSDTINLNLDLNGGSKPCNTTSPSIAPGGNCTVVVEFDPQPGSPDPFLANLTITSNASNDSSLDVPLRADQEEISAIDVRINQVETNCPGTVFTAYVSVTDQGGYPVTTLKKDDFLVIEDGGYEGQPTSTFFVSDTGATISVALVMDYSRSIRKIPDALSDMEDSAVSFVNQLGVDDETEIVKFGRRVEVVDPPGYTSNKALLTDAIYNPLDVGDNTRLYDAVVKAVETTIVRSKDRKAVILITDGEDDDGTGTPLSDNDLNDAINYANNNGVPIFTVGLGNANVAILTQMADETGGQFFEATTSDNLRTIYQQLADLLFHDQYILTYISGLGDGVSANLTIEATYSPTIKGDDTKEITACP